MFFCFYVPSYFKVKSQGKLEQKMLKNRAKLVLSLLNTKLIGRLCAREDVKAKNIENLGAEKCLLENCPLFKLTKNQGNILERHI